MTKKKAALTMEVTLPSNTGSKRKGKAVLLSEAYEAGRLADIGRIDFNVVKTFAKGSEAFYAMVKEGKIPPCHLTGRRCSNSHFVATSQDGQTLCIAITVGSLFLEIWQRVKDSPEKLAEEIEIEVQKELAKKAKKSA